MIDVHMGYSPNNVQYRRLALESLNHPGFNVIEVSDANSALELRTKGIQRSNAEYISYVDDDDLLVNPDIISKYIQYQKPNAVFTNSNIIDSTGKCLRNWLSSGFHFNQSELIKGNQRIHQLYVVKRELANRAIEQTNNVAKLLKVEHIKEWPCELSFVIEVAKLTQWKYLPEICYAWRQHSSIQMHGTSAKYIDQIIKYYNAS